MKEYKKDKVITVSLSPAILNALEKAKDGGLDGTTRSAVLRNYIVKVLKEKKFL